MDIELAWYEKQAMSIIVSTLHAFTTEYPTGVCDKNHHALRFRNMPPCTPEINVVNCCFLIIGSILR